MTPVPMSCWRSRWYVLPCCANDGTQAGDTRESASTVNPPALANPCADAPLPALQRRYVVEAVGFDGGVSALQPRASSRISTLSPNSSIVAICDSFMTVFL